MAITLCPIGKMNIKTIADKRISPITFSSICLIAVGAIFIFSGIGKLMIVPPLENILIAQVLSYGMVGTLRTILPFIEISLGILLITRWQYKTSSIIAALLITYFIVNNAWLISIGKGFESCGQCLGWGIDTWPIGSIFIDLIMIMLIMFGVYNRKEVN